LIGLLGLGHQPPGALEHGGVDHLAAQAGFVAVG